MAGNFQVPFLGVVGEDFEGVDAEELTLTTGIKCVVVLCEDDGWWTVHTKSAVGIFPGSYIDPIEPINIPSTFVKVTKPIPNQNIKVGTVAKLLNITQNAWIIEHNGSKISTKWENVDITKERPNLNRKENSSNVQQQNRTSRPLPNPDNKKNPKSSVIDFRPLALEDEVETVKQLDPSSAPKKSMHANNPNNKAPQRPMTQITNNNASKKGLAQSERKSVAFNATQVKKDKPKRNTELRKSTYTRPVSIFGNYEVNSQFDIVFEKDKYNVYSMPDANRR